MKGSVALIIGILGLAHGLNSGGGNNKVFQQLGDKLVVPDSTGSVVLQGSVSLNEDGRYLAVGAPG